MQRTQVPFPKKRYHILYGDPAWEYEDNRYFDWEGGTRPSAETYYPVMSIEEIKKLPIKSITEKNAVLYLWATFPLLPEALEVIKAWGFEYKSIGFLWIKITKKNRKVFFGQGAYTKSNPEPCLFATKGKVGRLVKDKEGNPIITDPKKKMSVRSNYVSSVVHSIMRKHSEKPPEIRNKIVEVWGDISRIELFSRHRIQGWDVWGNEIPKHTQKLLI